jgi:hypothetical protein
MLLANNISLLLKLMFRDPKIAGKYLSFKNYN